MDSLRPIECRGIMAEALKDPGFRSRLAAAMAAPLRGPRDYGPPCGTCNKSFFYDSGHAYRTGGADDGCPECIVRLVLES